MAMLAERDLRPVKAPPQGELDSRTLTSDHIVGFLHGQLSALSPKAYQRLTLGLAKAGEARPAGKPPLLAPFLPSAGKLLHHLPDALDIAEAVRESTQQTGGDEKPLAEVIGIANRALRTHIEEDPEVKSMALKERLRETLIAELNGTNREPVPHVQEVPIFEFHSLDSDTTEEVQKEERGVLERLNEKLKTATVEEYKIFLGDLQTTVSPDDSQDSDALLVKYLAKALQYSLEYSADKDKDWRSVTELGNYVLEAYIEARDPNEVGFNLKKLQTLMRRTFNADLDNPFIALDSLPPLELYEDPKLNRDAEQDRNNVYAIKRAKFAKKVSKELAERGDLSPLTRKTLELWGVSEADVLPNMTQFILEGQDAGDELTKKYKALIKYLTNKFARGTKLTQDDAYEIGTEAFMLLLYEFDPDQIPLKNYIGSNLKNRMVDILRQDNKQEGYDLRTPMFRETRNVLKFLDQHGLPINPATIQQALDETFSDMTVEEVLKHARLLPTFASLEWVISEGSSKDIYLGDTLSGEKYVGSPNASSDPTFHKASDGMGNGLMATLLDQPILTEKEKMVLTEYYVKGRTLGAIGKERGVTESAICLVHTRAVRKLRTAISENPDLTAIVEDAFAVA